MHIFLTGVGVGGGRQDPMWRFLLGYLALAVLLMKKSEWRSLRGGLAVATALTFLMYLFVPDRGFGGNEAKIRFSWAFFVLAGLFSCTVSRLRLLRPLAAACIAWWLGANLLATYRTAQSVDAAAQDYTSAMSAISPGAFVVRLRYAAPTLPDRFGYAGIGRDPLFHLDARIAAKNDAIDLSDYEALTPVFPVAYKKTVVNETQQSGLWAFEGPDSETLPTVIWLDGGLPRPLDYIVVIGDPSAPEAIRQGMTTVLDYLNANTTLVAVSPSGTVRLYRRDHPLPHR
jgi:hypothetical protein